jgi:3-oxoacyl-[acyl-carrier protein] reductase
LSDQTLSGRVAVVTGAARNIGRQIALELASSGAAVVVNALHSRAEAEAVASAIETAGGHAIVVLADVTSEEGAKRLVASAIDAFGRLDCVVNNAAVRRETAFSDLSYTEWREVLDIILDGAFLMAKAAQSALALSDNATIINIGGMSAHTGAANRAHVVTAKAGLVGLTKALANDLAPQGITVNCVVPGIIGTVRAGPATHNPSHHATHTPLVGRRGRPEEVAALVQFLAGPGARYLTGQTIHANGGAFLP